VYRNRVDLKYSEYELAKTSVIDTFRKTDPHFTYVTGFYDALSERVMMTTRDGRAPYDEAGNFILTGTGRDWSSQLNIAQALPRARNFKLTVRVKVDTAGTSHSGLHVGLHGTSTQETGSRKYRRHVAVFWRNEIITQIMGNGREDTRGSILDPALQANQWYRVELLGSRSGTALTVWPDGTPKPRVPQSVLYSSDWTPSLQFWIYNGKATLADLQTTLADVSDADRSIGQNSDFYQLAHQRQAQWVDYMGAQYYAGAFENLFAPQPSDSFRAIASLDFGGSAQTPCWQELDGRLSSRDANGAHHVVGDGTWYWEGISCQMMLRRSDRQQLDATIRVPALQGEVQLAIQGESEQRHLRRHGIRLLPSGGGGFMVRTQNYTQNRGWQEQATWGPFDPNRAYRFSAQVDDQGSRIYFEELEGDRRRFGPDVLSKSTHPGRIGEVDSSAADWDPYFILRVWKDDIAVQSIVVR
jgi:hypothetical protein